MWFHSAIFVALHALSGVSGLGWGAPPSAAQQARLGRLLVPHPHPHRTAPHRTAPAPAPAPPHLPPPPPQPPLPPSASAASTALYRSVARAAVEGEEVLALITKVRRRRRPLSRAPPDKSESVGVRPTLCRS